MITHFKEARSILNLEINLRERRIVPLLRGALNKNVREQWNVLMGNKKEKVKFPRDQGTRSTHLQGNLSS